jgi:hypothetical protein
VWISNLAGTFLNLSFYSSGKHISLPDLLPGKSCLTHPTRLVHSAHSLQSAPTVRTNDREGVPRRNSPTVHECSRELHSLAEWQGIAMKPPT